MTNQLTVDLAALVGTKMTAHEVRLLLADAIGFLDSLEDDYFTTQKINRGLRDIADRHAIDLREVIRILGVIVQGRPESQGVYETMATAGKLNTLKLVKAALRALTDRA